jgi:hypothetical protein
LVQTNSRLSRFVLAFRQIFCSISAINRKSMRGTADFQLASENLGDFLAEGLLKM